MFKVQGVGACGMRGLGAVLGASGFEGLEGARLRVWGFRCLGSL